MLAGTAVSRSPGVQAWVLALAPDVKSADSQGRPGTTGGGSAHEVCG